MINTYNIVPQETIDLFKKIWVTDYDRKFVNWYDSDNQSDSDADIIDERIEILPGSDEFKVLSKIVKEIRPEATRIWAAYQRQSKPHNIHLDDLEGFTETMVIPLNHDPLAKVLVWKQKFENVERFRDFLIEWGGNEDAEPTNPNLHNEYDIDHTQDPNNGRYPGEYMELLGDFSYDLGTINHFPSFNLHCSSDWTKIPGQKFKELVIIHTN